MGRVSNHRLATVLVTALVAAVVTVPAALAHGDKDHGPSQFVVVRIAEPAPMRGDLDGFHWTSGPIDGVAGELVYAGTGCTAAGYTSRDVDGKIVVVDEWEDRTDPSASCPTYSSNLKVLIAEQFGAVGFVQVVEEGSEPQAGTDTDASIPAIEMSFEEGDDLVDHLATGGTAFASLHDGGPVPTIGRLSNEPCRRGLAAGIFPCDGVDLLSFVPRDEFEGEVISDLWGWTDAPSGREFVLVGKTNGVAFFEITDPFHPRLVGVFDNPARTQDMWMDMKVYADHAFIVSESVAHHLQVLDLRELLDVSGDAPLTMEPVATYVLAVSAHNLAINTETGFAYIAGGNELFLPDQCRSGLQIVDIRNPSEPGFAGCVSMNGGPSLLLGLVEPPVSDLAPWAYVHDAQCVIYHGPDTEHVGKEICVNSAENKLVIVDVTDKLLPVTLGVVTYPGTTYAHQGWLSEGHKYFIANDELDELVAGYNTRTLAFNVRDLDAPEYIGAHEHDTAAIDHNSYVRSHFAYQSNYTAGLRIIDLWDIGHGDGESIPLRTAAYFDTFPENDHAEFAGTWSNYPYFPSGTIAVSGMDEGLFLLRAQPGALRRHRPG